MRYRKGADLDGKRGREDRGRCKGRGNCNQDTSCEEKNLFSIKGRDHEELCSPACSLTHFQLSFLYDPGTAVVIAHSWLDPPTEITNQENTSVTCLQANLKHFLS